RPCTFHSPPSTRPDSEHIRWWSSRRIETIYPIGLDTAPTAPLDHRNGPDTRSPRQRNPMHTAPFDIIRAAYAALLATDLERSRRFYVDILGLVVTHEDDDAIYLRAFEEYLHHSLVLRKGDTAALAALAYRVRSQDEVALAATHFESIGCAVERRAKGA